VAKAFDLTRGIGAAGLVGELDPVDDVAAIARQFPAVLLFHRRGARLRILPGDAADLHHRQRGGVGEHHGHLQEHAQEVADIVCADIVGAGLGEAFRAVATLQQETFAHGDPAERLLEVARLAGKDQRGEARDLPLNRFQRRLIGILGNLENRLLAPTVARPTLGHDRPSTTLKPWYGRDFPSLRAYTRRRARQSRISVPATDPGPATRY
jgi:hypothetical protein